MSPEEGCRTKHSKAAGVFILPPLTQCESVFRLQT